MGGKPPISIITDQDRAMRKAIVKVFPITRHRYCLWHIKKKCAEKLGSIYFKKSRFKKAFKRCIFFTYTPSQFEVTWQSLIHEYSLESNQWLKELYNMREMWIPTFCRTTFFAGMNTTQRSESMNSFFNEFLNVTSSLRMFIEGYDKAQDAKYGKEKKEEMISSKRRVLHSNDYLLNHAEQIYTRNSFNKFEEEWKNVCLLKLSGEVKDGDDVSYKVSYIEGMTLEVHVCLNLQTLVGMCGCHLFEFSGIPCKHLLAVFQRHYIVKILQYFILKRWTKNATDSQSFPGVIGMSDVQDNSCLIEAAYAANFRKEAIRLSKLATKTEEGRKLFADILRTTGAALQDIDKSTPLVECEVGHIVEHDSSVEVTNIQNSSPLLDPRVSQTKGRKKTGKSVDANKRLKGGLELSQEQQKNNRKCHFCGAVGQRHDKRTCPLNPANSRKRICQDIELEDEETDEEIYTNEEFEADKEIEVLDNDN